MDDSLPAPVPTSLTHRLLTLVFLTLAVGPMLAMCIWVSRGWAALAIGITILMLGSTFYALSARSRARSRPPTHTCPKCGAQDTAAAVNRLCPKCGVAFVTITRPPTISPPVTPKS